jgi:hypothetical protein
MPFWLFRPSYEARRCKTHMAVVVSGKAFSFLDEIIAQTRLKVIAQFTARCRLESRGSRTARPSLGRPSADHLSNTSSHALNSAFRIMAVDRTEQLIILGWHDQLSLGPISMDAS